MNVESFLGHLTSDANYRGQICHRRELPARPARFADPARPLPEPLQKGLAALGISRLYLHQAKVLDLAREGKDVVVVTGTASGKSLCYNLPILEDLLAHPDHRALYLFPTKALAQDQLRALETLTQAAGLEVSAGTYDGDTPPHTRRKLRAGGQLILTNPDMLHAGILTNHGGWAHFFSRLRWVVVDEVHTYRGVFGSNVALLMRRLLRVAGLYGGRPQFLAASATVRNPGELAEKLFGRPVEVVDEDGAPRGPRTFIFWNPPVVDRGEIRRSATLEARDLLVRLVEQGVSAIAFSRTRGGAELLYRYTREALEAISPRLARLVRAYRAGYLPEERRRIEQELFSGQLRAVCATSALELGIDVGDLDASILVGYPGSIASTWQQAGRAGRRDEPALAVLIAQPGPIDQYLVHHPDYFFELSPEHAVIDPGNPYIALNHLRAALAELPLRPSELAIFGRYGPALLELLEERGEAIRRGGRAYWTGRGQPATQFGLRTLDDVTYTILLVEDGREVQVLGTTDEVNAFLQLHPEAVYLHGGECYFVDELDLKEKVARVHREDLDYYTQAIAERRVQIEKVEAHKSGGAADAGFGPVSVLFLPYMFKKIRFSTRENVGYGRISLPSRTLETVGLWIEPSATVRESVERAGRSAAGGLLGLANVLAEVVPLYAMCDPQDIGTAIGPGESGRPAVFLYDQYPGGLGFSERVFRLLPEVLESCLDLIDSCACADGCPSCVGAPLPGPAALVGDTAGLVPDKLAALLLLSHLTGRRPRIPLPAMSEGWPGGLGVGEAAATALPGSDEVAATETGRQAGVAAAGMTESKPEPWPPVEHPLSPALEQRLRQKLESLAEASAYEAANRPRGRGPAGGTPPRQV
ncbi:MAG: DEAD/DEAH box helicase [Limnochordales bacterium]|nr:DEAD/DEAH box helicase [Limnochordales bacterium]